MSWVIRMTYLLKELTSLSLCLSICTVESKRYQIARITGVLYKILESCEESLAQTLSFPVLVIITQ